ncbi:MAG: RecX family transcriptional regulator, partial [Treponema sp.]|nr:RecX family transcriptional regulator [Treponema sp.]
MSDGTVFLFKQVYLSFELWSEVPQEISADEETALQFASACLRVENVAMALAANAEQTMFGLSRKLEARGFAKDCVKAVVARLMDQGIVNDGRYSRLWLESRLFTKADSPRKLTAFLCNKGIDRKTVEHALKTVLDRERERVLLKKYLEKLEKIGKGTERQLLRREGFSYEVIEAEM